MIRYVADAATASEGVPPWLIYLGPVVIVPVVTVLVAYLRKLLRVEDPNVPAPASPPTSPASTSAAPAGPDQTPAPPPPPAPAAPSDPQWEMIEAMVGRLQTAHDGLVIDNRELTARVERQGAQIEAQQQTIDELRATLRAVYEGRGPSMPFPPTVPPPLGYR